MATSQTTQSQMEIQKQVPEKEESSGQTLPITAGGGGGGGPSFIRMGKAFSFPKPKTAVSDIYKIVEIPQSSALSVAKQRQNTQLGTTIKTEQYKLKQKQSADVFARKQVINILPLQAQTAKGALSEIFNFSKIVADFEKFGFKGGFHKINGLFYDQLPNKNNQLQLVSSNMFKPNGSRPQDEKRIYFLRSPLYRAIKAYNAFVRAFTSYQNFDYADFIKQQTEPALLMKRKTKQMVQKIRGGLIKYGIKDTATPEQFVSQYEQAASAKALKASENILSKIKTSATRMTEFLV